MIILLSLLFTILPILAGVVSYFGFGENPFIYMILCMAGEALLCKFTFTPLTAPVFNHFLGPGSAPDSTPSVKQASSENHIKTFYKNIPESVLVMMFILLAVAAGALGFFKYHRNPFLFMTIFMFIETIIAVITSIF